MIFNISYLINLCNMSKPNFLGLSVAALNHPLKLSIKFTHVYIKEHVKKKIYI